MPDLDINGTRIYYEDTGRGAGPVLFLHGVLWSGRMFDAQVAAFQDRYRCVRMDFRGQGRSAVPRSGYDMDSLMRDVVALMERLELGPVHVVGLSMGGFVGMRLASRRPDLVRSLVLIGSAAGPESPEAVPAYRVLNFVARWFGLNVVAGRAMRILFGRRFLLDPNRSALRREMRRRLVSNHRLGITRAVRAVIERRGVLEEIGRIRCPTLVIAGELDAANPPDRSRQIQRHIGGAQFRLIPHAGHSATIEEPDTVNIALTDFWQSIDGLVPVLPPAPEEAGVAAESPAAEASGPFSGGQRRGGAAAGRKKAAKKKTPPAKKGSGSGGKARPRTGSAGRAAKKAARPKRASAAAGKKPRRG